MKIENAIKQKKFESPLQKAIINLFYTYNWIDNIQKELFQQYDVTPQQYNILRILKGKYPNSLSASEIKEVMIDKNPDLTRLCDRLIAKQLIEREYNEFNRRQVLIKITKKGIELIDKMSPEIKKRAKVFNLTDKEAETLSNLLDKLRE